MNSAKYIPEPYWNEVARQIKLRSNGSLLAGDDEPYYRYKRSKFLRMLNCINFTGKKVLEIGPGPGGNLLEIYKHNPAILYGADISDEMIALSRSNTGSKNITVLKTDGINLPFPDGYFDILITSTVLQHIIDEINLNLLIENMCRVSASDIYIFERIERKKITTSTNTGRTVDEYVSYFDHNHFCLQNVQFVNLHVSYLVCGFFRKIFTRRNRPEGEPESRLLVKTQQIVLPLTKMLDHIFKPKRDLAMLHFKITKPGV